MVLRFTLLTGAVVSAVPVSAQPTAIQTPPSPAQQATDASKIDAAEQVEALDDEEIVITAARRRGQVLGDIPPEDTLDARDVRATGATNITELLDALAPQIGSAQGRGGGRPVLLLDGRKVSGFRELRELRDIPTEAIEHVDILPEEVALKYGYRADQKVVNIVLRPRFRSTAVTATGKAATEGGYASGVADVTRLMISRGGRTSINVHAEGNGLLTENERDIVSEVTTGADPERAREARSLLGSKRLVRGAVTANRSLGETTATINAEVEHNEGRSLIGLGGTLLDPLGRRSNSNSAHVGLVVNGSIDAWQWTVTGNGDLDRSISRTDRDDPLFPRDRTRQTVLSGDLTGTTNGKLFKLPAGDASATITAATETFHLDSERERLGVVDDSTLGRTLGRMAANVDLPISRRNRDFSALGDLTLSVDGELARVSDFGTLTKVGANAFWSPTERVNVIASWSREEGAPTINQLGDPILEIPGARIFDFTTGQTVLATAISGGNPDLDADRRTVTKIGANWKPSDKIDLRLRADYVRSRTDRPIQSIFGPTPALETAFLDRFVREDTGRLLSVDLRPINFDEARRDTLRFGIDFTKPLKSRRPSQSVIDQLRAQYRRDGGRGRAADAAPPAPPQSPAGEAPPPPPPTAEGGGGPPGDGLRGGFGRGGRGGGGGFFGGGNRGRLTFSLTDTITFRDEVRIGPGLPVLDYLAGEASGSGGGTPRHRVEAQAGWANNGLGARFAANWRSGTRVGSRNGETLRFSPLMTIDLRTFANLGEQPELVIKHPWLRGSSLRFEVTNLLDAKPKVRDSSGVVPLNYQPDLLDPLGRTVSLTFRKLFLPSRASMRRDRGDGRAEPR